MPKKNIMHVPQHSYVEINRNTPSRWAGAYSSGMDPCRPVVVTNRQRSIIFFSHADSTTQLANPEHGVPAWLEKVYRETKELDEIQVLVGAVENNVYGDIDKQVTELTLRFFNDKSGDIVYDEQRLVKSGALTIIPFGEAVEICILREPNPKIFTKPYYNGADFDFDDENSVVPKHYDVFKTETNSLRECISIRPVRRENSTTLYPPLPFFIVDHYIDKEHLHKIFNQYITHPTFGEKTFDTSGDDPTNYYVDSSVVPSEASDSTANAGRGVGVVLNAIDSSAEQSEAISISEDIPIEEEIVIEEEVVVSDADDASEVVDTTVMFSALRLRGDSSSNQGDIENSEDSYGDDSFDSYHEEDVKQSSGPLR